MKIFAIVALGIALTGCATRAQNFIAGAAVGAIIADHANQPRAVYVPPPTIRCYDRYLGRDVYGRTVYQQVCRTY